jgi:two-component system response regulator AtoC
MRRVLLVEADETTRRELLLGLRERGIDADGVADAEAAAFALERGEATAVVLGVGAADQVGRLQAQARERREGVPPPAAPTTGEALVRELSIIVMIDGGGEQAGLEAMRAGAVDFVAASGGAEALALALEKSEARRGFAAGRRSLRQRARAVGEVQALAGFVGESPGISAVIAKVRRFAPVPSALLIGGESGTGKELVAAALHRLSPWRDGPFVPVNCGAIPAGLIESELFGHMRGAFTDAVRDKTGLFEAADGGTLFLDEIADLPLELQAKLLRVLQDGIVRRVGANDDLHVQVRIVAATARDLLTEVRAGRFREDLYYRLAGLEILLPPLRARRDDIPLLAEHFLRRACDRLGLGPRQIDSEAMILLVNYPWPGNVRELENTIERAAVLCVGERVDVASLPDKVVGVPAPDANDADLRANGAPRPGESDPAAEAAADLSIKRASREIEDNLIRRALARTGGNRVRAAELLEISHRALLYKIKDYGIEVAPARRSAVAKPAAPSKGRSGTV